MFKATLLALALTAGSASAITLKFVNHVRVESCCVAALSLTFVCFSALTVRFLQCGLHTTLLTPRLAVWPAVGHAPYGSPSTDIAWGTKLAAGASASFGVADSAIVCAPHYPT